MTKIVISKDFATAIEKRFDKYFRFDNSKYWIKYYEKKLKKRDFKREILYADLIASRVGKGSRVLEIGSGYGFLAKEMWRQGLDVHCVDLFENMLILAKKYLADTEVKIKKADILNLPYKKKSFDCISLMSIIEHFPYNETNEDILPYVSQFINKDGYLFIHVPISTLHSKIARFIRKYIINDLPDWAIDDDGDVTHRFWISHKEYLTLFEHHDFDVVNFDFRLQRSNEKPHVITLLMNKIQILLSGSDEKLTTEFAQESPIIKIKKKLKSKLAVTGYYLLRKKI